MRFAVMNQRNGQAGPTGLTAQQQKIFEMNNNMHGVGMNGAPLAMAYQGNNTNQIQARKKISTQ